MHVALQSIIRAAAYLSLAALAGTALAAPAAPSTSHPMTIQVIMSPKAQAKLQAMGELVKVSSFYDGPPIPSKRKLARGEGLISIAPEDTAILPPTGGVVSVKAAIPNDKWGWVSKHFYTINITSARKAALDNLLTCPAASGDLAAAPKAPIVIACKLIYGE